VCCFLAEVRQRTRSVWQKPAKTKLESETSHAHKIDNSEASWPLVPLSVLFFCFSISASFLASSHSSALLRLPFHLHLQSFKRTQGCVCVCVCCSGALLPWPVGTGIPLDALLVVSVLAVRCCSVLPLQLSRQGPQGACHCHCSASCLPLFRATVPFTVACHCSVFFLLPATVPFF
jgi:hypothetical protein